jgi:hypothetical protein
VTLGVVTLLATGLAAQAAGPALPPPRRVIEAERLLETAERNQGSIMHQDMSDFGPDWSGNGQLWWFFAKPGGVLRLYPTVPLAGRYEIYVGFTQAADYGQIRIQVDDLKPKAVDLYAGTVRPFKVLIATGALAAGRHRITIEITGKNQLAKEYNVGLDRIELVPVKPVVPVSM